MEFDRSTQPEQFDLQPELETQSRLAWLGSTVATRFEALRNGVHTINRNTLLRVGALASAATLTLGVAAERGIINADSAAAENVPAHASNATSSLQKECTDTGLITPVINDAYMLNPGSEHGRTQTVVVDAEYKETLSPGCSGFTKRFGQAKIQALKYVKKVGRKIWVSTHSYWRMMYSRDTAGIGGLTDTPSGHEGSVYWEKGDKWRVIFRNVVKNLQTGKITAKSPVKKHPIEIR